MREASDEDAERRYIHQMDERANEQRVARRRQARTRALGTVARAARNTAGAQLQPVVFAHAHGAPVFGPDDEFDIGEDLVAVPFY
jgi:hypothetical protein